MCGSLALYCASANAIFSSFAIPCDYSATNARTHARTNPQWGCAERRKPSELGEVVHGDRDHFPCKFGLRRVWCWHCRRRAGRRRRMSIISRCARSCFTAFVPSALIPSTKDVWSRRNPCTHLHARAERPVQRLCLFRRLQCLPQRVLARCGHPHSGRRASCKWDYTITPREPSKS